MWKISTRLGSSKGFTLVELILVMAILGILAASTTMMAIIPNLKRARDTQRKVDLENIRSAMELYKSDTAVSARSYPALSNWNSASSVLNPYISGGKVPADPTAGSTYTYYPTLVGCGPAAANKCTTYKLCAALETAPTVAADITNCGSCGPTCNYVIYP